MQPRSATAFLFLLATPAASTAAERITFGDWVLECAKTDQATAGCQLRQTLADGNGRRILQLTLKRGGGMAFLEAITPLSISIPFGVMLITEASPSPPAAEAQAWTTEVSGSGTAKPGAEKSKTGSGKASTTAKGNNELVPAAGGVPLQLASCDPDGCRAVAALDEALLAKLKAAPRLAVRFQDSKSGKVLTIEASPQGLGEGAPLVLAAP